jgi:multiple sugar transport system permease protein
MFPKPIEQPLRRAQIAYTIALPIALILWLLPLLGVADHLVKPAATLPQGNYFGCRRQIAFWQLRRGVHNSPIGAIHPQLVQGDDPDGDRRRGAVLPDGLCAGIYRFRATF